MHNFGSDKYVSVSEIHIILYERSLFEKNTKEYASATELLGKKLYHLPLNHTRRFMWSQSSEDFHAAGLEALAKSLDKFDFTKSDNFLFYGNRAIRCAVARLQKREIKWIKICKNGKSAGSLDQELLDPQDLESDLINKQTLYILIQELNRLDLQSKRFLRLYLGFDEPHLSYREIANKSNTSYETVRRVINYALKQMRKSINYDVKNRV